MELKPPNLMMHTLNDAGKHLEETDPRPEFLAMEKYCRGLGFDFGPGTNRLSPTVLCSDWYPHKCVDLVWNCVHEGGRYKFPFSDNVFDFVFASHVIEDFAPEEIQFVFDEMLRMIKPEGYFIVLIPDMEGGRYPDWDERFTSEDEEVIKGERQIGDTKGNPAHRITAGMTMMNKLVAESKYTLEVVQSDTIPHTTMTLDFVIKKK